MTWFRNLKLTRKLATGLGTLMLVLLIFALFTFLQNRHVETVARESAQAYETTVKLREVQVDLLDMSSLVRGSIGDRQTIIWSGFTIMFPVTSTKILRN